MSILSDALRGKTTWATALTRIGGWVSGAVNDSPALTALKGEAVASVKQGVSNALALVDTELAQHYAQMIDSLEAGADAALVRVTGGVALPAIPIMNATIKQIADAGRVAFDAWELEQQSKLAPPSTVQPTLAPPPPQGG